MSTRYSISRLGLCLVIAVAGLVSPAAAQQLVKPQWVKPQWVTPRTPDGHPALQGNWNNETLTPFERPEGQSQILTPDEVETIEGRRVDQVIDGSQASDPERGPAPVTGRIGRSYNEIYYNRGERVAIVNGEPRSSLLTNPPDGRRPSRTTEGDRRRAEYSEFRSQFDQYDNPENRPLAERCLMSFGSNAGPPMTPNGGYNNNYTIV